MFLVPQDVYFRGFLGVRIPGCLFRGCGSRPGTGQLCNRRVLLWHLPWVLPQTPTHPIQHRERGFSQFTPPHPIAGGGSGWADTPSAPQVCSPFPRGTGGTVTRNTMGWGDPWQGRQPPRTQNIWVSLTQHFGVWVGGHGPPPGPVSHWPPRRGAQGGGPRLSPSPSPPSPWFAINTFLERGGCE